MTEVTELTTVVQIVTVEQTRGYRGRGDNQECEDRNRRRQPYGKTDEPSLHGTMSGCGSGLTKRRSGAGIELSPRYIKSTHSRQSGDSTRKRPSVRTSAGIGGTSSYTLWPTGSNCTKRARRRWRPPPRACSRRCPRSQTAVMTPHPDAAKHKAIRNSRNRFATATSASAFHLRSARSCYEEELSSPDR